MADILEAQLAQFLQREKHRRSSWEKANCALWVADWVRLRSSIDPASVFRTVERSEDDWQDLVEAAGGLAGLIAPEMDRCGFERTANPQRGDVAIVTARVGMLGREPVTASCSAICLGAGERPLCVMRTMRGFRCQPSTIELAWRV